MHKWLKLHQQALKQVLNRFSQHKVATLLIALVIASALTLPSVMFQVLSSLQGLVGSIKSESQISLFLNPTMDAEAIAHIKTTLEKNTQLKNVSFIAKEDALTALQESSKQQDVLKALEKNPLPDAFIVEPVHLDSASIESLNTELSAIEGIDEILIDSAWMKRLNYLLALGNKAMFILIALLGFALITIIGNTIRMQIMSQQAEIELSYLIGATNDFIRRPFLYAGALYGLLGGMIAVVLSYAVISLFNRSILPLAAEYQSDFFLSLPTLPTASLICLLSLGIGIASAYFAVSKSRIKPI